MMNILKQVLLFVTIMTALFADVAAQKIKLPPGIPQLAGDLQIAKLWVSEHPAVSGYFNTYSAQPSIQKTKGTSYGNFTVETVAFDSNGNAVRTCAVEFSFVNKDQEFIEHPKLNCEITDEKTARSVVRWQSKVDSKNVHQESNEKNNSKEVSYRPNLQIKQVLQAKEAIGIHIFNGCFVPSKATTIQVEVLSLREGLPKKTVFTRRRPVGAINGNAGEKVPFPIPADVQELVLKQEYQLVVTIDPDGVNQEIYLGDNKMSLGKNAKLPAISLKPTCVAN